MIAGTATGKSTVTAAKRVTFYFCPFSFAFISQFILLLSYTRRPVFMPRKRKGFLKRATSTNSTSDGQMEVRQFYLC